MLILELIFICLLLCGEDKLIINWGVLKYLLVGMISLFMFLGFVIVDNKFLYFNVFICILVFEIIVLKLELNLLYI